MTRRSKSSEPQEDIPAASTDGETAGTPTVYTEAIAAAIGAAFFLLTLVWLIPVHVPRPSFMPGFAPGPDFWPRIVSLAGLVFSILRLGQLLISGTVSYRPPERESAMALAAALAAFAIFPVLLPLLGFVPTTALLALVLIALTGGFRHRTGAALVSLALPIALWGFFSNALGTRFPTGTVWHIFGF